jgi:hypothetical protein
MAGEGNPSFVHGKTMKAQRNKLSRVKKPIVCEWCGATENVQVHHIDHDRSNHDLSNLTWLCQTCNILEAQLWALVQNNRAIVTREGNQLIVTFAYQEK